MYACDCAATYKRDLYEIAKNLIMELDYTLEDATIDDNAYNTKIKEWIIKDIKDLINKHENRE